MFDFSNPITWSDVMSLINAVAIFCVAGAILYVGRRNKAKINIFNKSRVDDDLKTLYLVDGDNNIKSALKNLASIGDNASVLIFFSQEGAMKNWMPYRCSRVNMIKVEPGKQAVDNRIKSYLGSSINQGRYQRFFIVSHDKGFEKFAEKCRVKHGVTKSQLDVIKSI